MRFLYRLYYDDAGEVIDHPCAGLVVLLLVMGEYYLLSRYRDAILRIGIVQKMIAFWQFFKGLYEANEILVLTCCLVVMVSIIVLNCVLRAKARKEA